MIRLEVAGVVLEVDQEQAEDLRRQLGPPANRRDESRSSAVERTPGRRGLIGTKAAAAALDMSEEFIRDHADDYGGIKVGNVWKFDPERFVARRRIEEPEAQASTKPRRKRRDKRPESPLLEVRGDGPYAAPYKAAPGDASTSTGGLTKGGMSSHG